MRKHRGLAGLGTETWTSTPSRLCQKGARVRRWQQDRSHGVAPLFPRSWIHFLRQWPSSSWKHKTLRHQTYSSINAMLTRFRVRLCSLGSLYNLFSPFHLLFSFSLSFFFSFFLSFFLCFSFPVSISLIAFFFCLLLLCSQLLKR